MRALLVDDDLLVCNGLRKLVPWNDLGFDEILEAHNGQEAYEIAMTGRLSLIIADISMPVMSGLELCRQLKKIMVDTSVILLSAYDDFEYARTAITYGVLSYQLKPLSREKLDELIVIIRQAVTERKKKQEYYLGIFGDDMHEKVITALKELNGDVIMELFASYLKSPVVSNEDRKLLAVVLVNILFDYFSMIGFSIKSVIASKEKALNDILEMNTINEIENYVLQMYIDVVGVALLKRGGHEPSYAQTIKEYIQNNYSKEELSLSYLSTQFSVSPSYLGVLFKQNFGINITSFITDIRMDEACKLLKQPFAKVNVTANQVGFHDQFYFAKVFKRQKGMTPSEYHNMNI